MNKRSALAVIALLWPAGAAFAWVPGPFAPPGTGGFVVDRHDRSDVVSFWHAVYQASEGYHDRVGWTGTYGSTAAGAEGTTAPAFGDDVERRINWFRAMAGVPAGAQVNSGSVAIIAPADAHQPNPVPAKAAACQRSALMISRSLALNGNNPAMSHDPPTSCTAWTPAAWNANKNGNLAQNFYGPGAIDAYLREVVGVTSSISNDRVGHRRWILARDATDFATGDTPGAWSSPTPPMPSNCLYVSQGSGGVDPAPPDFAAYPCDGYFPAPLNSRYWSLSYPGASFSSAVLAMTDAAGNPVPVTITSRSASYGDRSLVWEVPAAVRDTTAAVDRTYHVTVTQIGGSGVPASKSYSVTLIDPWNYGGDPVPVGASSIPATGANYRFAAQPADLLRLRVSRLMAANPYLQGAEDEPAPAVVDRTAPGYPLRSAVGGYVRTGSKAFRLTFDKFANPARISEAGQMLPDDQIFELADEIVPGAAGQLRFHFRRAYMTSATRLDTEYSTDGGVRWTSFGSAISGNGSGLPDGAFGSLQARSLPAALHDLPVRLRFRFHWAANLGGYYSRETYPDASYITGVFVDDISLSDCQLLADAGPPRTVAPEATSARFEPLAGESLPAPGEVRWLRLEPNLGGHWFSAPVKAVTVTAAPLAGYEGWLAYDQPGLSPGFEADDDGDGLTHGVEYALGLDPATPEAGPASLLERAGPLSRLLLALPSVRPDIVYGAQWSDDLGTWHDVPVIHVAGQLRAEFPHGGTRFARWKISRVAPASP